MPKNFWKRIETDDGEEVVVHVNRRGCEGRWTKEDDAALTELVKAVHAKWQTDPAAARPSEEGR